MSETTDSNIGNNKWNGFVVCVASIIINYVRYCLTHSFGVFIAEFKKLYERSMAELNWVLVMVIFLTTMLGPIPTLIIRRFEYKGYMICSLTGTLLLTVSCIASALIDHIQWLFLTYSVIYGFGSCMIFLPSTLIINEFFPPNHRYHIWATCSYQLSFCIALMVSSPFFAWIIKLTSWRIALFVGGAQIFVPGIICSLLFLLPKPISAKSINESISNIDDKWLNAFKTPARILWLFGIMIMYATRIAPVANLPHYMENEGYGKLESSLPLVTYSIFEIVTCVVAMPIGSKFRGKLIYVNILSCLLYSILLLIWAAINPNFIVIMVFSSALGLIAMLSFVYIYATTLEVMNMKADIAWTTTCIFGGIGSLLSPVISGAVFDIRGSYNDVFYVIAAVGFINCLIFVGVSLEQICCKKDNPEYEKFN